MNSTTLFGRVVRDSELKYTQQGTAIARFSLAVNHSKEEVSYFDIVVWGKYAESMNKYLAKGAQVGVVGELKQSRWEKDGQSRSKVEVHARTLKVVFEKDTAVPPEDYQDDDIPF